MSNQLDFYIYGNLVTRKKNIRLLLEIFLGSCFWKLGQTGGHGEMLQYFSSLKL